MTGQTPANARAMATLVIRAAEVQDSLKANPEHHKMWRADPLGWWFALAYLGRVALGFDQCEHLDADDGRTQHWDSAAPTEARCEQCVGTDRDEDLHQRGLLPAYCGSCGEAEATETVSTVLDTIWILGRVCGACRANPALRGGAST